MNAYSIKVGKPEGKRPLGRVKSRCENNIKMYLRVTGRGGTDLIDLDQNMDQRKALLNKVINIRGPKHAGKFLSSCTTGAFSIRTQLQEDSSLLLILVVL
jgi:hypothetical protein